MHETNEFLESIFSTIQFQIAYMDVDFNFIRVNQAYADADGRTPEFYFGKNHFALFPNEENQEIFRMVVETGRPYFAYEKPFTYCNSPERGISYWDWTLHPVKAAGSEITGVILVLVDVTTRKFAQDAMAESERRFRIMTEAMDDVFWMATPDRENILYVSPAYEKLWGLSVENLYAFPASFMEAVHPSDRHRVKETVENRTGKYWDYEYRIIRPDGKIRWVRDKGYPVHDVSGELQMITGVASDITDLKVTEQSLRTSKARIRRLSSELINAQENERKLLAREIHDSLGSGLAGIKIGLENILSDSCMAGTKTHASLTHMVQILRNTIDECRRIQKGLRPPMLDELGIVSAVEWHCGQFEELFPHIRLDKHVAVDEDQIPEYLKIIVYRIMQEALNNVAKHSEADQVVVVLQKAEDQIHLKIRDNGAGFDPDDALGHHGFGVLGMKERVEISGGSFMIDSVRDRGTWIRISWPASEPISRSRIA